MYYKWEQKILERPDYFNDKEFIPIDSEIIYPYFINIKCHTREYYRTRQDFRHNLTRLLRDWSYDYIDCYKYNERLKGYELLTGYELIINYDF